MRELVATSAALVVSLFISVCAQRTVLAQSAEITRVDSSEQRVGDPGDPPTPGVAASAIAYRIPCDAEPVVRTAELERAGKDLVLIERNADVIAEAGDNTRATAISAAAAMTELQPGETALAGVTTAATTAGLYCAAAAAPFDCVQDAFAQGRAAAENVVAQSSCAVGNAPGKVTFQVSAFVEIAGFADEVQLSVTVDAVTVVVFGSGGLYEGYVFEDGVLVQFMWGSGMIGISHTASRVAPAGYVVDSTIELSRITASATASVGSADTREVEVHAGAMILNALYVAE